MRWAHDARRRRSRRELRPRRRRDRQRRRSHPEGQRSDPSRRRASSIRWWSAAATSGRRGPTARTDSVRQHDVQPADASVLRDVQRSDHERSVHPARSVQRRGARVHERFELPAERSLLRDAHADAAELAVRIAVSGRLPAPAALRSEQRVSERNDVQTVAVRHQHLPPVGIAPRKGL